MPVIIIIILTYQLYNTIGVAPVILVRMRTNITGATCVYTSRTIYEH